MIVEANRKADPVDNHFSKHGRDKRYKAMIP